MLKAMFEEGDYKRREKEKRHKAKVQSFFLASGKATMYPDERATSVCQQGAMAGAARERMVGFADGWDTLLRVL